MINNLEEYNSLIIKKTDARDNGAKKAAQILSEWFKVSKDIKLLAQALFDGHHKVVKEFVAASLSNFDQQEIADLCLEFDQRMRVVKVAKEGLKHTFTLLAGAQKLNLLNTDMLNLLKQTISFAQHKGSFAQGKCEALSKQLLEPTAGKILAADYSSWSITELASLDAYLQAALPDLATLDYRDSVYQWRTAYHIEAVAPTAKPARAKPAAVVAKGTLTEQVIYAITPEMVAELTTLYHNAFEKNNAFKEKEDIISAQKATLLDLQQQIQVAKDKIAELGTDIAEKEAELTDKTTAIQDMDDRMRNVFSWDERSKKQELLTLKKDITNALKLRYDDYQTLLAMPMSADSYAFSKATLTQIFKILKRYDIEL